MELVGWLVCVFIHIVGKEVHQ